MDKSPESLPAIWGGGGVDPGCAGVTQERSAGLPRSGWNPVPGPRLTPLPLRLRLQTLPVKPGRSFLGSWTHHIMSSDSWAPTCPVTEGLRCLRGQGWAQLGASGPGGGDGGRGRVAVVGTTIPCLPA